ncbi:MAG: RNA 2',3'-cyclic phosphodiesterase [Pirellulaceae bacterium]
MKNIRTFVAVEVSPDVQSRAGSLMERLRASGVKVTWTKLPNLHLTLKFLGDTPETLLPDVCRAVSKACQGLASFEMQFGGAGAFPSTQRPQTLWLGVQSGLEQIAALQQSVDNALFALRFPRERRRYLPHLTLGRTRGGTPAQLQQLHELLEQNRQFEAGVSYVEEVIVFASTLDRENGPTYDVLSRTELP